MAKKNHHQHDKFFKIMMSYVEMAVAFLKVYLPGSVRKRIDWKAFKLFKFNPESVLGKSFSSHSADMVYTTKLDGQPACLIAHCEHQSTLNEETYLRAEVYSRLIYMEYRKMHPKALRPAIISIIYFHGKENTKNYPTCLDDLKPPKPFDKYFLKPLFVNVNDYSDEALVKHGKIGSADLMFKYSIKSKPPIKTLKKIFKGLQDYPTDLRENSLYYMGERFNMPLEELFNQAKQYFEEGEIMRAKDQWRQEWMEQGIMKGMEKGMEQGMEKGREEGREEGIQKGRQEIAMNAINSGIDIRSVAKLTNLPLTVVKALKQNKKKK